MSASATGIYGDRGDEPLDELVTRATVDFYDQYLKDDPEAAALAWERTLEFLAAHAR